MANVTDTTRRLPASTLGPTARHPHFRFQDAPAPICPAESLNERDRDGMFTDQFVPLMPYTHQAIYDRTQEPQDVPTVELENDHLIVSVLPGWGGRITRCFDKGGNRELLFENPVLQPANLAIRNAWFSGGIEWNGPLYGHSLLTCSPVYVGRITGPFGPGVRIWEFDRSLETTWQVDLHLDDDSPRLWIRVTVINPNPHAVDYYWWTNIAVPENDRTRVLAPSSGEAVFHDVEQNVLRSSFPHRVDAGEPFDGSYPANYPRADSVFFDLHGCRRPWLAGAEADGRGLLHTSGELLVGRKFFVWGRNPGGRRWTDFLAQPGKGSYIELQAGLKPTQLQTKPLAAGERFTWTECILPLSLEPEAAHGEYEAALTATEAYLDAQLPAEVFAEVESRLSGSEDLPPEVILHRGSSWGGLYETRTGNRLSPGLVFDADPSDGEAPWAAVWRGESMPEDGPVGDWCVLEDWLGPLTQAVEGGKGHWKDHLHLGVAAAEQGDFARAREHLGRSNELQENAFAWMVLGKMAAKNDEIEAAEKAFRQALALEPEDAEIAVTLGTHLQQASRVDDVSTFLASLPAAVREHERILLLEAWVALERRDFARIEAILEREFATIREGEETLSDLWYACALAKEAERRGRELDDAERKAFVKSNHPPDRVDFRMRLA